MTESIVLVGVSCISYLYSADRGVGGETNEQTKSSLFRLVLLTTLLVKTLSLYA